MEATYSEMESINQLRLSIFLVYKMQHVHALNDTPWLGDNEMTIDDTVF